MDDVPSPVPSPDALGGPEPALVEVGRSRGRIVWMAAFVAIVALIGGVVVIAGQDDDIDADEALAQAQELVEEAESYRFELRTTSRTQTGDPDGAGSDSTDRTISRGAVAAADRWSIVEELSDSFMDVGSYSYETRRVADRIFSSGGGPDEAPVGPAWTSNEVGDRVPTAEDYAELYSLGEYSSEDLEMFGDDPTFRLQALLGAYLLPVADDPRHVERLIQDLAEPAVEEELAEGGVRLRGQLPPIPEIAEAAEEPVPPVALSVDLDEARRPTVARFDVAVEGASETVEVRFHDWGVPIEIVVPADGDVDVTPWIEEEWLATLDPALLTAPTSLPRSLELTAVYVYPGFGDHGEDDPDCLSVDLTYGGQGDAEYFESLGPDDFESEETQEVIDAQPYLDVSTTTLECGLDDTPFDGEVGGRPARNADDGYLEVLMGDHVVTVSSENVSDADVAALVRSLRRTSVEELGGRIPQWARDQATDGYWGPGFAPGLSSNAGASQVVTATSEG